MNADRFDALLCSLSTTPSRRGVLQLLSGSALGGLVILNAFPASAARGRNGKGKRKGKKKKPKVTVCHNGQTITVAQSALGAHLAHGDTIGPCAGSRPVSPPGPCSGVPEWTSCGEGLLCREGACISERDTCPVGADVCNGTCPGGVCLCGGPGNPCSCYTSRAGQPRCGANAGCGNCESDAECIQRHGLGAFCVGFVEPNCVHDILTCPPDDTGFCATPC